MKEKFYIKMMKYLPKKIVYFATIRLICEATTGKYSNTIVPELGAMEAVNRYARIHNMHGHGKD